MSEHALDAIPTTYEAAVHVLAAAHSAADIEIYWMSDPKQEVVRLIEVSSGFPPGGVDRPAGPNGNERVVPVFAMGSAKDFPFRSEIVQITPVEWDALRAGKLKLNRNWGDLKAARKLANGN